MIIKASKRGGAKQLAIHLMSPENDHVEVLRTEGFMVNKVPAALHEIYAVSRATKCKKFMMSISFNPPQGVEVTQELVEETVKRCLKKLNLEGQPFCLIAHEKEGRRHYHCVVSLIDTHHMKAIKQPYYKKKLNNFAKTLFIENNWDLPKGFIDKNNRDPRNFTLAEWQQAKRHKLNPKLIKQSLQQCWAISDCKTSFTHALTEQGYFLAQGDRRGYVAVDWNGEVYSLTRALGVKTKELKARIGDNKTLPTIETINLKIADEGQTLHKRYVRELTLKHQIETQPFIQQKSTMIKSQRRERSLLKTFHEQRHIKDTQNRQTKIRKGLRGLWDFITGSSKIQHQHNEVEAQQSALRDKKERGIMINQHINQRQKLQTQHSTMLERHQLEKMKLQSNFVQHLEGYKQTIDISSEFNSAAKPDIEKPSPTISPNLSL